MHIKEYIQAAYEAITQGGDIDAVLKNLQALLSRRGLGKMYPRILRGLLEKVERGHASDAPKVLIARTQDMERHKVAIEAAVSSIAPQSAYAVETDETIIGGFIVSGKGKRIDQSYKSTLLDTYHRLVD